MDALLRIWPNTCFFWNQLFAQYDINRHNLGVISWQINARNNLGVISWQNLCLILNCMYFLSHFLQRILGHVFGKKKENWYWLIGYIYDLFVNTHTHITYIYIHSFLYKKEIIAIWDVVFLPMCQGKDNDYSSLTMLLKYYQYNDNELWWIIRASHYSDWNSTLQTKEKGVNKKTDSHFKSSK